MREEWEGGGEKGGRRRKGREGGGEGGREEVREEKAGVGGRRKGRELGREECVVHVCTYVCVHLHLCVCVCVRERERERTLHSQRLELLTLFLCAVPNYKVLHHYEPQNEDDLALVPGEYVTLDETPYGGGWWKGTIEGKGTGWFPKTYVDYVDREAERKRRQDGESAMHVYTYRCI